MEEEKSISTKLRELRAKFDKTQADIAKVLGISQQTYSKYEDDSKNAGIDSSVIIKLCEYYGISADYLLNIKIKNKPASDVKLTSFTPNYPSSIDLIVEKVLSELKNERS